MNWIFLIEMQENANIKNTKSMAMIGDVSNPQNSNETDG